MATEVVDAITPEPEYASLEAGLDALESGDTSRKPWWRRVLLARSCRRSRPWSCCC
jgi:hypothetical protein